MTIAIRDGEQQFARLKKNDAEDITHGLRVEDLTVEENGDDEQDNTDDDDAMPTEDSVAEHKARWQERMEKLQKYADNGKVEKLQKANEKQNRKLQKVRNLSVLCSRLHAAIRKQLFSASSTALLCVLCLSLASDAGQRSG